MTAQAIDVAVRLTLFFLLIWPPLRLLARMLEGSIWRSYGLTPRSHLVLMESVWERRFTRLLQFAAVVVVYDWIGQDMGGGQATFWIAVGIVYSSTYWVTQAADWTLRFAARTGAGACTSASRALVDIRRCVRHRSDHHA